MRVTLTRPSLIAGIIRYEVEALGSACEVRRSVNPLACDLDSLPSGTRLTIVTRSCLVTELCGTETVGIGYTLPDGMQYY